MDLPLSCFGLSPEREEADGLDARRECATATEKGAGEQ